MNQPRSTNTKQTVSINPFPSMESLQRLAISESGFVFDPESGHHFTVNETGKMLLRRLQQENDLSVLLDELAEQYLVSRIDLERDILEFAGVLRDFIGV